MASGCVPGSGGRWVGSGQKKAGVYLIRFIADLPLRLVYGMHDSVPLNLLFTATCRKWGSDCFGLIIADCGFKRHAQILYHN